MRLAVLVAFWCLAVIASDAQPPWMNPEVARFNQQVLAIKELGEACQFADALNAAKAASDEAARTLPPNDPRRLLFVSLVSETAREAGDFRLALKQADEALALILPADLVATASAKLLRARAYTGLGEYSRAAEDLATAASVLVPPSGPATGMEITTLQALTDLEIKRGNFDAALLYVTRAGQATTLPEMRFNQVVQVAAIKQQAFDLAGAEQAVAQAEAEVKSDPSLAETLTYDSLLLTKARVSRYQGRLGEASIIVELLESRVRNSHTQCQSHMPALVALEQAYMHLHAWRIPEARSGLDRALDLLVAAGAAGAADQAALGDIYMDMASMEWQTRNYANAADLFERSRTAFDKAYGADSYWEAMSLAEDAIYRARAGDSGKALELAQEAWRIVSLPRITQPLAKPHVQVALAMSLMSSGRAQEAAAAFSNAQAGLRKLQGSESLQLSYWLVDGAENELTLGRAADARRSLETALRIQNANGLVSVSQAGRTQSLLAEALSRQGQTADALMNSAGAVSTVAARRVAGAAMHAPGAIQEAAAARELLERELRLVLGGAGKAPTRDEAKVQRAFMAVQLGNLTITELAITQLSSLFEDKPEVRGLLATRKSAAETVAALERQYRERLLAPGSTADQLRPMKASLDAARATLASAESALLASNAAFRDVAAPRPLAVAEAQSKLQDGQSLLVLLVGEKELTLVAMSKQDAVARQIAFTAADAQKLVGRVRASMDSRSFPDGSPPPFDVDAGYTVFRTLLEPVQEMMPAEGGTLIYIPDGAFTSLPLGIALTASAQQRRNQEDHASLPWLAKRYVIAVLPSANSLFFLQAVPRARAPQSFIGIGDPALGGLEVDSTRSGGAVEASLTALDPGTGQRLMDPKLLRRLNPLPQTRPELEQMQIALKTPESPGILLLGVDATETAVRSADLNQYRVVVFATHGVVAGEGGASEPGLVLTPPEVASAADDGYLAASEIAANLKLQADLVVLSACNTGAGDGRGGAVALSGLARAFFYAGARSLVVSHWYTPSRFARDLNVAMIQAVSKGDSPATAARKAQLEVMVREAYSGHPYYWGAFSFIGAP